MNNVIRIALVLAATSPLAACGHFGTSEILVDKTLMPGGYGAIIRVAATESTPGLTAIVTPDQQVAAAGGNGYIGDVIGAAGNILKPAPVAIAASIVDVNANAGL